MVIGNHGVLPVQRRSSTGLGCSSGCCLLREKIYVSLAGCWMKMGLVLYYLNWVILIDDNKMSIKVIDWCRICLINVCVKDNVDDKDVLPVFDRATSMPWNEERSERGYYRAPPKSDRFLQILRQARFWFVPVLPALIRCLLLLLLVRYFVLNRLISFP